MPEMLQRIEWLIVIFFSATGRKIPRGKSLGPLPNNKVPLLFPFALAYAEEIRGSSPSCRDYLDSAKPRRSVTFLAMECCLVLEDPSDLLRAFHSCYLRRLNQQPPVASERPAGKIRQGVQLFNCQNGPNQTS